MKDILAFIIQNWIALLFGLVAFIEVVVRLTPSTKDNAWFKWVKDIIDFIFKNNKKGGGSH